VRLAFTYAKVPANLPAQEIAEFGMSWNSRTGSVFWITPPGMFAPFANKYTALAAYVRQELATLHAEM